MRCFSLENLIFGIKKKKDCFHGYGSQHNSIIARRAHGRNTNNRKGTQTAQKVETNT